MTEETKKILETFNNQKEISPNFGAEGLDDVFKSKIDRSPQTLADVEKVMKDGYIILPSLLTPEQIAKVKATSHFYQAMRNQYGRTYFEGEKTTRVNNLVNKSDAVDCMLLHPRVLNILDHILHPNYLISATQAIEIGPGEHKQPWHFDDGSCRQPRPRRHFFVNCFWAMDAFTKENGGTHLIPGSHLWGDELPDIENGQPGIQAECPAGSCVMYLSTVWHSGGANRTDKPRMGIVCIYGEPWMRPYDNQFLSTDPRDITKLPPRLQQLLGYSVGAPFLGWVDGKHPFSRFRKGPDGETYVEYFKRVSGDDLLEWEKSGGKKQIDAKI